MHLSVTEPNQDQILHVARQASTRNSVRQFTFWEDMESKNRNLSYFAPRPYKSQNSNSTLACLYRSAFSSLLKIHIWRYKNILGSVSKEDCLGDFTQLGS